MARTKKRTPRKRTPAKLPPVGTVHHFTAEQFEKLVHQQLPVIADRMLEGWKQRVETLEHAEANRSSFLPVTDRLGERLEQLEERVLGPGGRHAGDEEAEPPKPRHGPRVRGATRFMADGDYIPDLAPVQPLNRVTPIMAPRREEVEIAPPSLLAIDRTLDAGNQAIDDLGEVLTKIEAVLGITFDREPPMNTAVEARGFLGDCFRYACYHHNQVCFHQARLAHILGTLTGERT